MDSQTSSVAAFVLAGGRSLRMGADKAFIDLGGRPLIAHALGLASAVTHDVHIVGEPAEFSSFADTVSDSFQSRGPLAGIHAALASSKAEHNLILGVDLPFVKAGFLQFLVSKAQGKNATVTLPQASGHFQTLCAVYRQSFMPIAACALEEGRNKIDALFPEIAVDVISEQELTAAGFSAAMFRNLNTPEDLEAARREFHSR